MQKKRGRKYSAIQKLADILDIPSSMLPWGMDIEINNDHDVFVDGCKSISEYTSEKVVLCSHRMKVVTEGEDFELYTFSDGRVRISGRVRAVTILREGEYD